MDVGKTTTYLEISRLCACQNLRKAARAVTQRYDEVLRPTGLRATQLPILVALGGRGPLTVNSLAEVVGSDPTTVTRNLRPLEQRGLLRTMAGEDRRERIAMLTERGQHVLARAVPLWRAAQARMARDLGKQRLARLLADLEAAVGAVREH